MKFKSKKRRDRAARRDGVCRHCAPVADFKLPVDARNNTASAPCPKCGRVLVLDLDALGDQEVFNTFIFAISPWPDVCTTAYHLINEGDPIPEDEPHAECEKAHLLLVRSSVKVNQRAHHSA